MLEPKGDRKSCSQIKTVAPNKISDQNSCLPPPCKSPTHHHHPFAHSCLPFPSLANPHRPRPPCNLLPPTVPSCTFLLPWQLPAGVQLGGHLRRGFFLPTHFLAPLQNATPPRYKFLPHLLMPSVPPLIANPPHHPFCKFPPAPPNSPPCQSPRVEILLPLPCPLFCKSLPPLPPFSKHAPLNPHGQHVCKHSPQNCL